MDLADLKFNADTETKETDVTSMIHNYKKAKEKEDNNMVQTLRTSIQNLISNPSTQRYLRHNVVDYCKVLSILITETDSPQNLFNILRNEFHKFLIESENFCDHFFNTLFPALITACIKFQSDSAVFTEVSRLVQKCIFSKNFKSFQCFLNGHSKNENCTDKHQLCKLLLKFMISLYSSSTCEVNIGFKLIFHSFSSTYSDFSLVYRMVLVMVEIIGFDVKDQFGLSRVVKSQVLNPSLDKSLQILNEIFDVLTRLKTGPDHVINEITFAGFIKVLVKSVIFLSRNPNSCVYSFLMTTAELNPLIIESCINEIIVFIMTANNVGLEQQYEAFMIKILEVFARLHRIQNLVSKMIPTLKSGLENREVNDEQVYVFRGGVDSEIVEEVKYNIDLILPTSVLKYFTNCVTNLASWQVMNLFKTLLFHLDTGVAGLSEINKKNSKLVYIEILSTFTCWLLASVRMAEHTVPSAVVEKFLTSLEELRVILSKFGTILLHREHNQVLVRAFLNISFNWAEIYMVLAYYSISKEIELKKVIDNDHAPCNLTYLHSYLTTKQWCLISERITNFGEKPCKEIMHKLFIQKLKAVMLFENELRDEMVAPVVQSLCVNFDEELMEIFKDRFVINNVLIRMPSSSVIKICEVFVNQLSNRFLDPAREPHIFDSQLIIHGCLCVVASNINKLMKQKRKHDEAALKKALVCRMIASGPPDMFLSEDVSQFLPDLADIIGCSAEETSIDIKINSEKIQNCLEVLKSLPVIFCPEPTQRLLFLLLAALSKDVSRSNCGTTLKDSCESIIIGLLQHGRLFLLDTFEASDLLQLIINNFSKSDEVFSNFVNNLFKDRAGIEKFRSGIYYLKDNLKVNSCLKCAIITLNLLGKMKRTKLPADTKNVCLEYRSIICNKIVKIVAKKSPSNSLVEPFALVLKNFLSKDEDDSLSTLKNRLGDYIEFALTHLCTENLKGSLLLFVTVLHNKSVMTEYKDDYISRIWNSLKPISITDDVLEEYSQLVILVTTLIPNEEFSNVSSDLLTFTAKSVEDRNDQEIIKHLKTWRCILSCNFNPIKTKTLQNALETLLQKLIVLIRDANYSEELFNEIIQFQVSIIETSQFVLTPPMIDIFLMDVTILFMRPPGNFVHIFNMGIQIIESLLKHRKPLIMDRLPPYLQQYRVLLEELCVQGDSNFNLEPSQVQAVADCAHKLEKLTKSLVLCAKDMNRISPYLIADILAQYERITLYPNVKLHLNNCVYSLISLCDQHAVAFLMRVLSNASREIFKLMYENFKKYYRFTGKV